MTLFVCPRSSLLWDKKQHLSDITDSEMQGNDHLPRLWPYWIFRGWQLSSYHHGTY